MVITFPSYAVFLPHLTVQSEAGADGSMKCVGAGNEVWREGRDFEVVVCVAVHLNHSYRVVVLTDIANDSEIAY